MDYRLGKQATILVELTFQGISCSTIVESQWSPKMELTGCPEEKDREGLTTSIST